MRGAFERHLAQQKSELATCPVCPVKGTCVFVTPGYEPGYCLHEYKLLHAHLARRLRTHPPAGALHFPALVDEARRVLEGWRRRLQDAPGLADSTAGMGSGQRSLEAFQE